MAYSVPDGAILEATIQSVLFSQTCLSVFHYQLSDSLGLPDGDAAINGFNTEWNDLLDFVGAYAGCCSQELAFVNIVYQWVYPTRYHRVLKTPVVLLGEVANPSEPPNVAQVVTRSADKANRHGIGTTHIPALPQTTWTAGSLNDGQYNLLNVFAGFQANKYVTNTMIPVLYNRANPAQSLPVTAAIPRRTVRVMRRRTVGVGI